MAKVTRKTPLGRNLNDLLREDTPLTTLEELQRLTKKYDSLLELAKAQQVTNSKLTDALLEITNS